MRKVESLAVTSRSTITRDKSGKTGPMSPAAFRNKCRMSSPTYRLPDSEKVGCRRRPRRPNIRAMPLFPLASRLA